MFILSIKYWLDSPVPLVNECVKLSEAATELMQTRCCLPRKTQHTS